MQRILDGVVGFLLVVFKVGAWLVFNIMKLALMVLQFFLLLFSLVLRLFFAFVRAGTV